MTIDFSQYQFLDQPPFFIGVDHDATDWYSAHTRNHLTLEVNVEYALRKCRRGTKAIDIGANIGHFTLPLANQGVSVLAVEALPSNYALLCQSITRNGFANTIPVHAAIHDSTGVINMAGMGAWGQVTLGPGGVTVPSLTLDDLCGIYNFWDASFVKLDVEGSERAAFRGAQRFIRQSRDAMFLFEANEWTAMAFNYPASELLALLEADGYHVFMFDGKNLQPRTAQSFQEAVLADYLACRSSAPPLVDSFICRPLTWEERIRLTLLQAIAAQPAHRAYILGMAATMPREISSDARVRAAIRQIESDLPDDHRPAAAKIAEAARARGLKT